ncbi:MAG: DUF6445 family protein [Pseudomonadota bacterium]
MFNPRPAIRYHAITAQHSCAVIDDFLLDPHKLIAQAVTRRAEFGIDAGNFYPGPELGLGQGFAFALDEFFMQHVRRSLGARRTISVSSRLSMATLGVDQLSPLQRLCHRDAASFPAGEGVAASVAYLFDEPRLGGTSFYVPRQSLEETARLLREARDGLLALPPSYMNGSNEFFEQVCTVPATFNRAIFYDGSVFHAAQIDEPGLLSEDPLCGRLTMNGFFRYRKSAS